MLTHTYDLKWLLDRRTDILTLRVRRFSYKRTTQDFAISRKKEILVQGTIPTTTIFSGGYVKYPHEQLPPILDIVMDAVARITQKDSPLVLSFFSSLVIKTYLGSWEETGDESTWCMRTSAVFHVYDRAQCIEVK